MAATMATGASMTDHHTQGPKSVTSLLDELDSHLRAGESSGFEPVPLGFTAFDDALGGGVRRGDLTVFAGPPGVGKTILGLQAARHLASAGRPVILVCYEHDQAGLLLRLLAQESGAADHGGHLIRALRDRLQYGSTDRLGLDDIVAREPHLAGTFDDLRAIGDRLVLLSGSARDTDLERLTATVADAVEDTGEVPVLIVDYLQKVPTDDAQPRDRSRTVVEGLKTIAMRFDIPVIAMASLNSGGLEARKLRLSHLDETSSIAFEADVVVLLNDKMEAVAKAHLSYGGVAAKDYPNWVIWGIAKNRSGPNLVDLEFRKDFTHFRFHPVGRQVSERLADDRLMGDAG